jgi:AAA+ superfamily predicted ATPase
LSRGTGAPLPRAQAPVSGWTKKLRNFTITAVVGDRYPLVIFHGDVGTGKTAVAEAAADRIARDMDRDAMLFKLSTRVRGAGTVGQMSTLINQAFRIVLEEAGKSRLGVLIIDEADSIAATRETPQAHHEDKVAVNTLIQKIDEVRRFEGRVLVILCTNRFGALDPAIVRRASLIERFDRPNDAEREALLRQDCAGLGLTDDVISELVRLTGPDIDGNRLGFTYSDLRTRLIPEALARAFPERRLGPGDFIAAAGGLNASPRLQ